MRKSLKKQGFKPLSDLFLLFNKMLRILSFQHTLFLNVEKVENFMWNVK